MAAPTIPPSNSQAVLTVQAGGTIPFAQQWWTFFNSLLTYITTGPIGPVPLVGVIDGSNAAAGNIGEYTNSFVLSGSAVNLPTATDTLVTSLSLTAGDWDLWGEIFFNPSGATISSIIGAIATTTTTTPTVPADGADMARIGSLSATSLLSHNGLRTRISITTTTSYRLVAQVNFSGGSVGGYGALRARRMR